MEPKVYDSLPVEGYRPQAADKFNLVNSNKRMEEETLRVLDHLGTLPDVDKRWLAIGRTNLEQAWMAVNRAIFKPDRVKL
jgi:hypothetical protein